MANKYLKLFIIVLVAAVIVPQVALAAWWNPFTWHWGWLNSIFHFQQTAQKQNPVACTMEAKQCPDGSYVGRQGPKCEFAPCPAPKPDQTTASWKTFIDNFGFKMNYPADMNVMVAPTSRIVGCNPADYQNSCPKGISPGYPDKNEKQNINGTNYCFYLGDDCGAGSCTTYYSYLVVKNNTCYVLDFSTARTVNDCKVYGSSAEVKKCQSQKDANQSLINQAISTIKFTNNPSVVGGDKDVHGCIGSAGYAWCTAKQKCLRTWEEKCQ